ncbi:zinc dependent phospholipase C family protein [Flavihumibacter fluvii]|uniref:zinc dependent phospholipase C family protein n=1 Tax=Flavihumibacter fluvii TaxID=2838157 RepID=UPI001BDEAA3D|nr:zinc dependent phospholipase C family protein [Flavihumibacter fluvii]ULQ51276.1 zinc dependent phospholipase C family protein [Flavihumibacter fluvii]
MVKLILAAALLLWSQPLYCWGFYGHRLINEYAIYLLPPQLLVLYKPALEYLREHAVDADKRRYILKAEAPRHYIDMDHYGEYPFQEIPRRWEDAVARYTADSLLAHGILPWRIQQMLGALTRAFREKNNADILRVSADLGHYIGDAHVPLHTSSNHNGQKTGQHGIHGFWESRLPELFAAGEWDFFMEKAAYINNPGQYTWDCILESAAAVDSVLQLEARLSAQTPANQKYAYEWRNQQVLRQYSTGYSKKYEQLLHGMVERRLRKAIHTVASFWYTAWVNAGQSDLSGLLITDRRARKVQLDSLDLYWRTQTPKGKSCD